MAIATETSLRFAEALNAKFRPMKEITVEGARKWDRILIGYPGEKNPYVHAFVERETGLLYKPAGWAAPVRRARYDLSTPEGFSSAVGQADPDGSYLYAR